MAFKSEAQRRKFGELVHQGKIPQKTFDEWNAATPKDLPERITPVRPVAPVKPLVQPSPALGGSSPLFGASVALRRKKRLITPQQ